MIFYVLTKKKKKYNIAPITATPYLLLRVIEQLVSLLVWGASGRGFEFRSPERDSVIFLR